jgi:uncharacterized membrane protein YeaQ/YmgE (transglycosylase-associated protein family)
MFGPPISTSRFAHLCRPPPGDSIHSLLPLQLNASPARTVLCRSSHSLHSSFFLSYRLAGWNRRLIFLFREKSGQLGNAWRYSATFCIQNDGEEIMLHLIWYIVVGLIAGVIAKSVMHVHMTIFWTIVLGIIGSIIGGAVTHMFSRPITGRFHPAGLIFSTLGAILILYVCIKLNIRFPRVL